MAREFWTPKAVDWQPHSGPLSAAEIKARYEAGQVGAWRDREAEMRKRETFKQTGGYASFADAAHANGLADSFAGQLVIPYVYEMVVFPGSLPGAAQARGDCESHGITKGCVGTMVGEIVAATPDEVSGLVEGPPVVPAAGIIDGVLSTEWAWWQRGYNGDGWSMGPATEAVIKSGVMLRQPYPDLGIDFTHYSYANTAMYGNRTPPENMQAVGRQHVITTGADCSSFEECRDALGNLHGMPTEGGEGFSSTRDQYGMSPRRGGWSHAFPFKGADDRATTKAKFGEGLILNMNNWGPDWNSGPRDIFDSASLVPSLIDGLVKLGLAPAMDPVQIKDWLVKLDIVNGSTGAIMIPQGSWWCRWSDVKNRGIEALAGLRGWAKKTLPNLGATGVV